MKIKFEMSLLINVTKEIESCRTFNANFINFDPFAQETDPSTNFRKNVKLF